MGNFFSDALSFSPIGSLLSGDKSKVDEVNYPDWYSDPNYTGSQDFLSQYSKDLLNNGPNDYYKPIGEYNTTEFQQALREASQASIGGTDAALARTGRARGGQGAAIAAQSLGDSNSRAAYQDYLRAMKGREMFLNTGLGVQQDVRNSGFANQGARNAFNVAGANFDYNKAVYGDAYDRQQSEDIGKTLGTVVGGVGGFMIGGPQGAMMGAGLGGNIMGGDGGSSAKWLDMLNQSKTPASTSSTTTAPSNGVSTLGSINPSDFLKYYSPNFGKG